jgi:hypothetical protein
VRHRARPLWRERLARPEPLRRVRVQQEALALLQREQAQPPEEAAVAREQLRPRRKQLGKAGP